MLRSIAHALRVNASITSLDLSENRFGDVGAISLADALRVNKFVALNIAMSHIA